MLQRSQRALASTMDFLEGLHTLNHIHADWDWLLRTQEFKEAARLAAKVKACVAEAQACDQKAAEAEAEAEAGRRECRQQDADVARHQDSITVAQRRVAHCQWRRLQVTSRPSLWGSEP